MAAYPDRMELFMAKVEKSPDGCWLWTACTRKGYGRFNAGGGRCVPAYRWSYEHFVGPIPTGMTVDHRCRVPGCVRPEHLRLATNKQQSENRGQYPSKSGYRGVVWNRTARKWEASVKHLGVRHYLGLFLDPAEAGEVARLKRLELFTHNEHDRKVTA